MESDDFAHLRDVRTFDEYQKNVLTFGYKERVSAERMIATFLMNKIPAEVLADSSCESKSEADFHFDTSKISADPDYRVAIFGWSRSLEIKHTPKKVRRIMIKKYDVDKYVQKKGVIILHIVDCDGDARFTLLKPEDVRKWLCQSMIDKFGGKPVYVDDVQNHEYFYFNKLSSGLYDFIRKIIIGK